MRPVIGGFLVPIPASNIIVFVSFGKTLHPIAGAGQGPVVRVSGSLTSLSVLQGSSGYNLVAYHHGEWWENILFLL